MPPPELPEVLAPLAFLVGTWRGEGVGGYPTIADFRYAQEITFRWYGKPVLAYTSRTWHPDGGRPLAAESGYWRRTSDGAVEVVLAHPTGIAEVYLGSVAGTKIEIATDVVVRTPTAKDVAALHRVYGLVGDELRYAVDMAAMGLPMQPHLSARLSRVPTAAVVDEDPGKANPRALPHQS